MAAAPDRAPWRAAPGTPLYLHLPFCVVKCPYCDFFSVPADGQDVSGLVEVLLRELELHAPLEPRTVFVGGGTPSLLPIAQLERLFDRLDDLTGFRRSAREVTAECNPESLDAQKARALVGLGVTRLSVGVQSLRDESLRQLGRPHSADQARAALDCALAAGARSVNADLIYALPDQDPGQWRDDLREVAARGCQHVAAYNLTFEEGTAFRRLLEQGHLQRLPEERELELFEIAREQLASHALSAYEVSNYGAKGHECAHNVNYWENGDYVGCGPSAVSCVAGRRFGNVRSISDYAKRVRADGRATAWEETLSARSRLGETWWLGLRLTVGVDPQRARQRAGWQETAEQRDPAVAVAERLLGLGLLERSGERWRLSARGLPLGDAVAREFLVLEPPPRQDSRPGAS